MLTPGIFGYLIWELKENWRLFVANRSKTLDPVLVGYGTASRCRACSGRGSTPERFPSALPSSVARSGRRWPPATISGRARKHLEVLHHVEIALRRYIQREFVAWFRECRGWQLPPPDVEEIDLATNEILVEVALPGAVEGPLVMAFELIDGRTHLCLSAKVCVQSLSDPAHKVLRTAIINVLKTGGIEVLDRECEEAKAAGRRSTAAGNRRIAHALARVGGNVEKRRRFAG